MTADEPNLSKDQDARVRRLLADARHTEPMPDDLVVRLDRVLAELAEHPETPGASSTPVELASRRRRRVTSLLVAAAAVVVLGIGLGQLIGITGGSDLATSRESGAASGAESGADSSLPDGRSGIVNGYALSAPVELDANSFSAQVARTARTLRVNALASTTDSFNSSAAPETGATQSPPTSAFDCVREEWGEGQYVPVLYEGAPGALVYRPIVGETQVVDLFDCGSTTVLRSITLPAP